MLASIPSQQGESDLNTKGNPQSTPLNFIPL